MTPVLIFATNFMPYPTSQEKNMWLQFVQAAGERGVKVHVLSVNNDKPGVVQMGPNAVLQNIPPVMVGKRGRTNDPLLLHRKMTRLPFGQIYQTLTTSRYGPLIEKLCREHGIRVVHFPQPLGLGIRRLKKRLPPRTRLTMSFSTYIERMGLLGKFYQRLKFEAIRYPDTVFVPSEAGRRTALAMGLEEGRLRIVRWAIRIADFSFIQKKEEERRRLGSLGHLIVSTGPIQEIGLGSDLTFFHSATAGLDARRVMLLKPDVHLDQRIREKCAGVEFMNTDFGQFQAFLRAADVLVSPVTNNKRTVPPPLTWIESMALGTPVATTPVPGVVDFIGDTAGIVASNPTEMRELLSKYLADPAAQDSLRRRARDIVCKRHTIGKFCDDMFHEWGLN